MTRIVEELQYTDFWMLLLLMGILLVVAEMVTPKDVHVPAAKWCFAAVFLGYIAFGFSVLTPDSTDLVAIAVRGLVLGTIAFTVVRIVVPLSSSAISRGIGGPMNAMRASRHYRRLAADDRRRKEEAERLRRESSERWERDAPLREQARLEEERRKQVAAADQIRRENARAGCDLLYAQHAPEIKERMPREDFDRFVQTYMDDTKPAEEVERRGSELQRTIEQHRLTVKPEKKPRTISQLSEWYLAEKARIDALPLDPRIKKDHLVQLDVRYSELTQELLQKMEP